jgi:hypothetical protein
MKPKDYKHAMIVPDKTKELTEEELNSWKKMFQELAEATTSGEHISWALEEKRKQWELFFKDE